MEVIPLIPYSDLVMIILTALAVLLTALAIGIGLFAVLGYTSLRDGVKAAVQKQVTAVMDAKMKEYPDSSRMVDLMERVDAIETAIGGLDQLKNKIVTGPAPKEVASASNPVVQGQAEFTPEVIPNYPEQEAQNAGNTHSVDDSGPDNS